MEDNRKEQKPATCGRRRLTPAMATVPCASASIAAVACAPVPTFARALTSQKQICKTRGRDLAARLFPAGTPQTENLTPQAETFTLNIIPFVLSLWLHKQLSGRMLFHSVASIDPCRVADVSAALCGAAGAGSAILAYALASAPEKLGLLVSYCCYGSFQLVYGVSGQLHCRDHDKGVRSLQVFSPNAVPWLRKALILFLRRLFSNSVRCVKEVCSSFWHKICGIKAASRGTIAARRWLVPLLFLGSLSSCEGATSALHYRRRELPSFQHENFPQPACIYTPSNTFSTSSPFPWAPTPVPVVTPVAAFQAPRNDAAQLKGAQRVTRTSSDGAPAPIQRARPLRASTLLQQQQMYRVQYGSCQHQRTYRSHEGHAGAALASGYICTPHPRTSANVPSYSPHHALPIGDSSVYLPTAAPMTFPPLYDCHTVPPAGSLAYTTSSLPTPAYPIPYNRSSYPGAAHASACVDCEGRCVPIVSSMYHPHYSYTSWPPRAVSRPLECYPSDPRHVSPRIHLSGRLLLRPKGANPPTPSSASLPEHSQRILRTSRTADPSRAASRVSAPRVRSRSRTDAHSAHTVAVVPRRVVSSVRPPDRRSSADYPKRRRTLLRSHFSAPPRASMHHGVASRFERALPSVHSMLPTIPGMKVYTRVPSDLREHDFDIGHAAALEKRGKVAQSTSSQRSRLSLPRDHGSIVNRFEASPLRAERGAAEAVGEFEESRSLPTGEKKSVGRQVGAAEDERRQGEQERQRERKRGRIPSARLHRVRSHQTPEIEVEPWAEEEEEEVLEPDEELEDEFEEEEEEDLEEPEYQEQGEEGEAEGEEDEEERNQLQTPDKVRRASKELSFVVHQPVKITDWDYSQKGEDWKIGRGGCASQERQSPINFDEGQQLLWPDDAEAIQQLWKGQEGRRRRTEAVPRSPTTQRRKGTQGRPSTRYSGSSWVRRQSLFPTNLMIDAKDDETKSLQIRLGAAVNRYVVKLVPAKKVEFVPEKHQSDHSNSSRKSRQLFSSFGFVRTGGKVYDVINFHFHAPAEHTFNMRRRSLELHIVCEHTTTDLVVIGITFEGVDVDATAGASGEKSGDSLLASASFAPLAASRVARPINAAATAKGAGTANKKHGTALTRKMKPTKKRAVALARSEEDAHGNNAESNTSKEKAHTPETDEVAREEELQVQKEDKPGVHPASSEEARRGHKRGEEETGGKTVISKGAHDFLMAVTHAIRVTLDAEGKNRLVGGCDVGHVSERSRQGKLEKNEEGPAAAAAPTRRLVHEDEEEGEPFRSASRKGRPWIFRDQIQDYPKDTSGLWEPWAEFDTYSTTFTSEESAVSSKQDSLPLLRTLPSGHASTDAQHVQEEQKGSGNTEEDDAEDGKGSLNAFLHNVGAQESAVILSAGDGMQGDNAAAAGEAGQRKESRKKTKIHKRRRTFTEAEKDELCLPAVNLQALLAGDVRTFYRYKGSLTTPPCSETVLW